MCVVHEQEKRLALGGRREEAQCRGPDSEAVDGLTPVDPQRAA